MNRERIGRIVRRILWVGLVAAWFVAATGPTALYAQAEPDSVSVGPQAASRLEGILNRFFGNRNPSGQALEGRAISPVERFAPETGKFIEVVLVHPVASFENGAINDRLSAQRLLASLTRPLRSYTNDRIIRDYLLFDRGQEVDPYLLADSERLLRNLPYISDAQLKIVPLNAAGDTVAVVVQTADRWPLGADADVVNEDEFRADLFSVNLWGTGVGFTNRLLYRRLGAPDSGYRGILTKENLYGSFWNAELEYENSHLERQDRVSLQRGLAHPGITVLGGASWNRYLNRREDEPSAKSVSTELWSGRVFRLYDRRLGRTRARPLLVPALRLVARDYLTNPSAPEDSNLVFHDNLLYLGGLYFQRLQYYKTSFLLGLGETENVPRGYVAKCTVGYQDSDGGRRAALFLDTGAIFLRGRGDVILASVDWGGFFRNDRVEEGMLRVDGGYFTPLNGSGRYRTRFSGRIGYTLGIRRAQGERLRLRPQEGQMILPDENVTGNQRLVSVVEANLFTPWSLAGFRVSCLGFGDAGVIGDERADSLWQERAYFGFGFGFNLRNPDLALPTWRITASIRNRVVDGGTEWVFGFRSVGRNALGIPGAKPALLVYR